MCGINGILRLTPDAPPVDRRELLITRDAMQPRGPDSAGLWLSASGVIGLSARRLAIMDTSPAGSQPMSTPDGRFTIVFNGEIYNFRELRSDLQRGGVRLRSNSDTEVVLHLFARDDIGTLSRLRGMYAFAIWDDRDRRLVLSRDPFGIKPLYVSSDHHALRFASQVKALEAGGAISKVVDPAGLAGFLLWGSVPEPYTMRKAVRPIPAGHWVEVRDGQVGIPQPLPPAIGLEQYAEPLAAIQESVVAHLVSDVPVGVFLSSGLDSAMVSAVAQRSSERPLRTITVSFEAFDGTVYDESAGAAEVARCLGTQHSERRLSAAEIEALFPQALQAMDQPSIDGFNVFLVSHAAHEAGLKVVLSGLGGDELFGSYPSFRDVPRWRARVRRLRLFPGAEALWPERLLRSSGRPKLAGLLRYGASLEGAYFLRRGLFLPEELPDLLGSLRAKECLEAYCALDEARGLAGLDSRDPWDRVQSLETGFYLRNQLLRDADWASMAHSLELRVPLVDVFLAAALRAAGFEPARSQGKRALARRLAPELPDSLFRRPKLGFMVPAVPTRESRAPQRFGAQARTLARRVLHGFGVEVRPLPQERGGTVFLSTEAFHRPGGIQTLNRTQVQALVRCEPAEPLSLLVLNDRPLEVQQPEWRQVRASGFARHHLRFALSAAEIVLRQRPVRIVFGHRNFLPLAPWLKWFAPGAEQWLCVYGIEAGRPLGIIERLLLRPLNRVMAISPQTAAAFQSASGFRDIELWPCSLPFNWPLPETTLPVLKPPWRLLTVSRLAPPERYKGIDDTINALALLRRGGLAVRLDIVGEGSDRSRLEALVRELELRGEITFHGRVSDEVLRRMYADCDVFVLPSGGEGFGIVYLEAMAYTRPVVGADAGGAPFVVRPGESGWLVRYGRPHELADCLRERLNNAEVTRAVALAGRRLLEREFGYEAFCERTASLLAGRQGSLTSQATPPCAETNAPHRRR
jgi:asparagine synthase (glutamine-hydrolysing)